MSRDDYENPLCTRYAGREMRRIFSDDYKFSAWRRLWIALAESERELGLPIDESQIEELRAHVTDIDYRPPPAMRGDCGTTSWPTSAPTATPARGAGIPASGRDLQLCGGTTPPCSRCGTRSALSARSFSASSPSSMPLRSGTRIFPACAYTHFQPAQPTRQANGRPCGSLIC